LVILIDGCEAMPPARPNDRSQAGLDDTDALYATDVGDIGPRSDHLRARNADDTVIVADHDGVTVLNDTPGVAIS
jgi:hypothetical protein